MVQEALPSPDTYEQDMSLAWPSGSLAAQLSLDSSHLLPHSAHANILADAPPCSPAMTSNHRRSSLTHPLFHSLTHPPTHPPTHSLPY